MIDMFAAAAWVCAVGYLVAAVVRWRESHKLWHTVLIATFLAHTVLLAVRWYVSGHPPIFGTHENTLAATWLLALGVLWLARDRDERVTRLVLPWLPVHLVFGLILFDTTPYPLTISERSLLVDVHVLLAWGAYVLMLVGGMYALQRITGTADAAGDETRVFGSVCIGFVALTAMIAVGAFYSFQLFGSWYTWEITETVTAAAWLAYGLVIHARLLFNWTGRRLAWLTLAVLPLLLLAFWVWSLYPLTYHHFDIVVMPAS